MSSLKLKYCFSLPLLLLIVAAAQNTWAERVMSNEKIVTLDSHWRRSAIYNKLIFLENSTEMAKYHMLPLPQSTAYRAVDKIKADVTLSTGEKIVAYRQEDQLVFPEINTGGELRFSYQITLPSAELGKLFFDRFDTHSNEAIENHYVIKFPKPLQFCWAEGTKGESGSKQTSFNNHFEWSGASSEKKSWLQITTACSWDLVKSAYRDQYEKSLTLSSENDNEKLLASWGKLPKEQQITQVLQYVREKIAYQPDLQTSQRLTPQNLNKLIKQGVGDCKDMTALSVTLLRKMNFDATAVLVAPKIKYDPEFPDPFIFNHAIVRLVWQGVTKYYDLTRIQDSDYRVVSNDIVFLPLDSDRHAVFTEF